MSSKRSPRLTRTNSCSATKSWQRGLSRSRRVAQGQVCRHGCVHVAAKDGASKEGPRSDGRANGPHGARDGGDTVLNLVAASGYLSRLMGNPRVSRYLDRHHPEILAELKVVVAATSLEESGSDCRRNNPGTVAPAVPIAIITAAVWPANSPWVAGLEGHRLSRLAHPARLNKK